MTEKMKRGLGLIAVAVIATLVYLAARVPVEDGPRGAVMLAGTAGLVALVCGLYGLVLLAWGLLRE